MPMQLTAIRPGAGRGTCIIADDAPLLERWLIVHRELRRAACGVRASEPSWIGCNPFSEANVIASPGFVEPQRLSSWSTRKNEACFPGSADSGC